MCVSIGVQYYVMFTRVLCYVAMFTNTSLVPVEGKSSHTHTYTHKPLSPFRLSLFDGSLAPNRDAVNTPFSKGRCQRLAGDQWPVARWFIQINTRACDTVSASFWVFFPYIKKLLGRTETQTRERKCFQSIRTV